MIDAYCWSSPNGQKLLIALEELDVPHVMNWRDVFGSVLSTPEYLAINPNGKIPAIIDHDGPEGKPITIFESGAVLLYLADKFGRLVPREGAARYTTLQWMFFNAGVLPLFGQLGMTVFFAKEKDPAVLERVRKPIDRVFGVLERRLSESRFVAGEDFSIADIMNITWPVFAARELGIDAEKYPSVKRWMDEVRARPAVERGLARKAP